MGTQCCVHVVAYFHCFLRIFFSSQSWPWSLYAVRSSFFSHPFAGHSHCAPLCSRLFLIVHCFVTGVSRSVMTAACIYGSASLSSGLSHLHSILSIAVAAEAASPFTCGLSCTIWHWSCTIRLRSSITGQKADAAADAEWSERGAHYFGHRLTLLSVSLAILLWRLSSTCCLRNVAAYTLLYYIRLFSMLRDSNLLKQCWILYHLPVAAVVSGWVVVCFLRRFSSRVVFYWGVRSCIWRQN